MRLEDLKKSWPDMTFDERMARVRQIREDRKVSKHAITVSKKREVDKKKRLVKMFEGMTPEEQATFLEALKEDEG